MLEKAYIKYKKTFYTIDEEDSNENGPDILYLLTGFVTKKLKTKNINPNKLNTELKKYSNFKIRIAYPNKATCKSENISPKNPYILQEIFKCDDKPVFVFKTLLGKNKILNTKW